MNVSAVIIAKNEDINLLKSLPKLYWCNEIIVVVDNPEDSSVAVAQSFEAKIIYNQFETFGKQKQFAVNQASNLWVLSIDADEILSDELIEEILKLDFSNTHYRGFEIPRTHVFMGKTFRYGKESKDFILRLFNKDFGQFDEAQVHEKIALKGTSKRLKNKIFHHSYINLQHYFSKFNIYTTQGALKLFEKRKKRALLICFLSFPIYFFKHYLLYLNVLNGWQGLVWSYLSAWYHTVKYLKLHELNANRKSNRN